MLRGTIKNKDDARELLVMCQDILKDFDISFDIEDIQSKSRKSELSFIRALIVVILRSQRYTLEEVGLCLNRDHATIIHLEKYEEFKQARDFRFGEIKKHLLNDILENSLSAKIKYHENELEKLKTELDKKQNDEKK